MEAEERLRGKTILIVDDEPDIIETLETLLSNCRVSAAYNYEEGRDLIENRHFDIAILDVMGVEGYELLKIARKRGITAVMLTARALGADNIKKSYYEGAAYYIPKERMGDINIFINDILEAKEKGRSSWRRWLDRFALSYCEKKFGPGWQEKDKDFWERLKYEI